MTIARIDVLVDRIRRHTAMQSFTDSATPGSQIGLQTQTIVDLLNEAHDALHGIIYSNAPHIYIKTDTINLTNGTESYTIPTDAYLGVHVLSVEYKYGSSGDYRKLVKADPHMRDTSTTGTPYQYIQHENSILINPIPGESKTDGLRITYERQLPAVDVRRGTVSTSTTTTITLTSKAQGDIVFGADNIPDYITVVDSLGTIKQDSIQLVSYSSTTGILTVGTNLTAVSANDYVVVGKSASTHSWAPDVCENFLVYYVIHAIFEMLGHPALSSAQFKLQQFTIQVADVFADASTDIMHIPRMHDYLIDFDTGD